jgi:hypothetical protein
MKTMVVIDYCIVSDDLPKVVAESVAAKIAEGWQPWGNLATSMSTAEDGTALTMVCQPMVKYTLSDWE